MRIFCLYLLWFVLLVPTQLMCQEGTPRVNPFEVTPRIESGAKPSTIGVVSQNSSANDTSGIDFDSLAVNNGNPFEVNHVPLRRQKMETQGPNALKQITQIKPKVSNQLVFGFMLFSLALLAIVITAKTNLISYLLRSVFNINMMKLTKRDEAANSSFLLVLLYIVFTVNASVFVFLLQQYYTKQDGIKIWAICFGVILGIYLIRHIGLWLLGQIFPVQKESSLYNYIIVVFNIMFGISIIPINLMLKFGPQNLTKPMFIIGIALFGIYFIIRKLRGLSISLFLIGQGIVSFFVYLCVFEIVPILIIVRAVLNLKGI